MLIHSVTEIRVDRLRDEGKGYGLSDGGKG